MNNIIYSRMSDKELSDEYTEDTRAFHRRNTRSPGLEESESGSESDGHNDNSDRSDKTKRSVEDQRYELLMDKYNLYDAKFRSFSVEK